MPCTDDLVMRSGEVVRIVWELLDLLEYLHTLSPPVYHRDIKPGNIMRRPSGPLALIDFGSVRDALVEETIGDSTVVGTFGYMAPEQFQGRAFPGTDLYGLGVTAAVLLTRREPHTMVDGSGRLQWRPYANVDPDLAALIDALVQTDPRHRVSAVPEARARLRPLVEPPVARLSIRDTRHLRDPEPVDIPGVTEHSPAALPRFVSAPVVQLNLGLDEPDIPELPALHREADPVAPQPMPGLHLGLAAGLGVSLLSGAVLLMGTQPVVEPPAEAVDVPEAVEEPPPPGVVRRIEAIGDRVENDFFVQRCFADHDVGHAMLRVDLARTGYAQLAPMGAPSSLAMCVASAANRLDLTGQPSHEDSSWPVVISRHTWTYAR